jgi:hypothetical protein
LSELSKEALAFADEAAGVECYDYNEQHDRWCHDERAEIARLFDQHTAALRSRAEQAEARAEALDSDRCLFRAQLEAANVARAELLEAGLGIRQQRDNAEHNHAETIKRQDLLRDRLAKADAVVAAVDDWASVEGFKGFARVLQAVSMYRKESA